MAMGRTWQESVQKALRGMEGGLDGFSLPKNHKHLPKDQLLYKLRVPNPDRFILLKQVREGHCRGQTFVVRAIGCCTGRHAASAKPRASP